MCRYLPHTSSVCFSFSLFSRQFIWRRGSLHRSTLSCLSTMQQYFCGGEGGRSCRPCSPFKFGERLVRHVPSSSLKTHPWSCWRSKRDASHVPALRVGLWVDFTCDVTTQDMCLCCAQRQIWVNGRKKQKKKPRRSLFLGAQIYQLLSC